MDSSIFSRLAPENWPFSPECLPQPVYMVGGAVRDAILGRSREYLDLDFIIPSDAVNVARAIAKHNQAGFVLLDAERQIARVVFPEGTADFAQQEGETLIGDLYRRDFTINAIAYNPHTQEIIDPLNGCQDLENGVLRMISAANLQDDPLRLMRAYRQSAQLNFTIEPNTQATIRTLASSLTQVAGERIRSEMSYLLASSAGTVAITNAWEDGLLNTFFAHATNQSLMKLAAVDQAALILTENWPFLGQELQTYVRDTVKTTWLGIAKLACLVHPNPELVETELQKLTYSRVESRAVATTLKLFPKVQVENISLKEQYFLFQEAGKVFTAIAVLALANHILVEPISGDKLLQIYSPLISRYLNPDDLVAHPIPLVNGLELTIALNIPASPLVGKLLREIAVAQVEGKVTTVEQAIAYAREIAKI